MGFINWRRAGMSYHPQLQYNPLIKKLDKELKAILKQIKVRKDK